MLTQDTAIRPATPDDRATLENLVQLYCYDLSDTFSLEVGADGRYTELLGDIDACWVDGWRRPVFITVGERLAGFAVVLERSRLTGAHGVFDMAEFFVMKRHRRRGVGLAAALRLFETFRGPWEVRQSEQNAAATSFWRKVIAEQTGGDFSETTVAGPPARIVQRFSTGAPGE